MRFGRRDLKSAKAKIEKECVGKSSCSIPATTEFFGSDPCFDTVKYLAVSATGCNGSAKPAVFTYDVTIPTASVRACAIAAHSDTQYARALSQSAACWLPCILS